MANEEATVEDFLRRVLTQLAEDDGVLCVLDLATRDATRALAGAVATRDPRVEVLWEPERRGLAAAYQRGYREALGWGFGWILEMDCGLSHLPEEIPRVLAVMARGVDFVAGCRFAPGASYAGRWSRRALSRGGTLAANAVLGTRMRDMTSGFQCFSRRAARHVLAAAPKSRSYFFQTEVRYLMHDLSWAEVPITYANPSRRLGLGHIAEAAWLLADLALRGRLRLRARPAGEEEP